MRFQKDLRQLGDKELTVNWKRGKIQVAVKGDFRIEKLRADGIWKEVKYHDVPEGVSRHRLDFSCAELERERGIPVHQFIYFICCSMYTKDGEGWARFKAGASDVEYYSDMMSVDHKGAWWQIERKGLKRITMSRRARQRSQLPFKSEGARATFVFGWLFKFGC